MKKVDILLSVYNPNMEFLEKQLRSLNEQDYPNLELIVFDDCIHSRCDKEIFQNVMTNVPVRFLPYEDKNLGYTKAFEKLVEASTGDYIALCDQDDIWLSNKISRCVEELEKSGSLAVATDRMIIDEHDNILNTSVRAVSNKPYDSWKSFDDICKYNIFISYAVGMSMVVNGNLARSAIPFSDHTGHDKWLLACASAEGTVSFIEESLVQYRRHGKNVSGTLKGINNKEDYMKERVFSHIRIIEDFEKKYPQHKDLEEIKRFAYARKNHNLHDLLKYRYLSPDVAKFEIVLIFIPNFLFAFFLKLVRKQNDKVIK
ncbi:glycosyltransferase [Erysipelotrichaceae bacterium HCN-30851]